MSPPNTLRNFFKCLMAVLNGRNGQCISPYLCNITTYLTQFTTYLGTLILGNLFSLNCYLGNLFLFYCIAMSCYRMKIFVCFSCGLDVFHKACRGRLHENIVKCASNMNTAACQCGLTLKSHSTLPFRGLTPVKPIGLGFTHHISISSLWTYYMYTLVSTQYLTLSFVFPATLFFQIDTCCGTSGWFSGGVYPCVR